jgi:hypothetical protein
MAPVARIPEACPRKTCSFPAATTNARPGSSSSRSIARSTMLSPSCDPPFCPRLTLITQGSPISCARRKMYVIASATWTESVNVVCWSVVSGCTKMIVASGAMPMNRPAGNAASPERPFPAAIPMTWVPCDETPALCRTVAAPVAVTPSVKLMSAAVYWTPCGKSVGECSPAPGVSDWSQSRAMRVVPSALRKSSRVKSHPKSTMPTITPAPRRSRPAGSAACTTSARTSGREVSRAIPTGCPAEMNWTPGVRASSFSLLTGTFTE